MKILIDCGFHQGENVEWFFNQAGGKDFIIYAFEPNQELTKHYPSDSYNGHLKIINKAVSTEDGKRKFYIMDDDRASSFYRKKIHNVVEEIEVECIDLCKWIRENINKDDSVFLKLDIEGEEHKLIPKLVQEGIFDEYINEMYVEFHQKKLRDMI